MADSASAMAAEIARSMDGVSRALQSSTKTVLKDAGTLARKELEANAKLSAGPDRQYSHFKGPKLGVKVKVTADEALVIPTGPWKIAEEGAAPHGGHPGTARTQGRRLWTRGQEATFTQLERTVPDDIGDAVERGFRG